MIKSIFRCVFLLIFISVTSYLNAQSLNLFGLWFDVDEYAVDTTFYYDYYNEIVDTIIEQDFFAGTQNFVQLNTETGLIETVSILDNVSAINVNSSTFNQTDREYSFLGRNINGEDEIYTIDVATGNYVEYPAAGGFPLELNFDLRNGVNYGFQRMDSIIGYDDEFDTPIYDRRLFLASFDAVTGSNTLLGEIDSLEALLVDGTAINSNEGLFYVIGKTETTETYLYTISLEDGSVINQVAINNDNNYFGLVYDNRNEKLLAVLLNNSELVEIDPTTAEYTLIGDFVFPNGTLNQFLVGTNLFDQNTSTYLFIGRYEGSSDYRLVSVNANTGELIYDPLLDRTAIELQVDNSNFANRFYNNPDTCDLPPSTGSFNCE